MQTATNLSGFRSIAFIGIGSNMDDPVRQVQNAFAEIDEIADTALMKVSSLYESAPIGYSAQRAFINAVVQVETTLSPQDLMLALLDLEAQHHRIRQQKNGPRTLDLDILVFNEWRITTETLVIPHPRAQERAFVLLPLLELVPNLFIPGAGYAREFLPLVAEQQIMKLHDIVPTPPDTSNSVRK